MQVKLAYVEQGNPSGIPVIMLHGWTDSWRSFERVLPNLPESLHVFALSMRGHGDSGRPLRGYTPGDFSRDVAEFMDALRLPRGVIVGHCMGGMIAQRFAADNPNRVTGLVLVSTFDRVRGNPGVDELWASTISILDDPVDPAFVREFQESTLGNPVPAAFLDGVVAESLKVPAYVWKAALSGLLDEDFAAARQRIDAPTLVLWGDRDSLVPRRDQDAIVGAITSSRLVVYNGIGHALHWEEPEQFARDVTAFSLKCASEVYV